MQYLVENGAEVSPKDRWRGTPLDDAVRHGHREVAEFIQAHGGVSGSAISEEDRKTEDSGVTADMCNEPDRIVELIYAASEGDLTAIQRLVARGVGLEDADYDLRTPLHLAAAEGQERIVQYFLDQGVARSPRDRWGKTPLDEAERHGHARVADLLNR